MNGIKIRGTGRGVPEKTVSNEDLARKVDTSDEWITARTGIRRRRFCAGEEDRKSTRLNSSHMA